MLDQETRAREEAVVSVTANVERLQSQLTQLHISTVAEANSRVAVEERLKKRVSELTVALEARALSVAEREQEFQSGIKTSKQLLDEEARACMDEVANVMIEVNQNKEFIVRENGSRVEEYSSLSEKLKVMEASLELEAANRVEAKEALMKRILEVAAVMENERAHREEIDGQLRLQADAISYELGKEVEERTKEMSAYRRDIHAQESKFKQQFNDLKQMFDLESVKRSIPHQWVDNSCVESKLATDDVSRLCSELKESIERSIKNEEACVRATTKVERLESQFASEACKWDKRAAAVIEHVNMNAASLANQTKEHPADAECMKLLRQARDQTEKEMADRKAAQEEILKQNSELGAGLEHENCMHDHALKTAIATLKQEVSMEREEHVTYMAASKFTVQSLEARMTEEFSHFRQCLQSEMAECVSAEVCIEKDCVDIKMGSDAVHAAIETLKTDLEEIRKAVTKTDEHLLQVFSDLNSEREDRTQDVTSIRSMLKIFDRHVSIKFNEAEHILNTEATERKDREQKLEERFAELRGAVLIATRGGCPNVEVAEAGREFNKV